MQSRGLGELEQEYASALDWLEAMGVPKESRFHKLVPAMSVLWQVGEMTPDERRQMATEISSAVLARVEAGDVVRVHRAYGNRASGRIRRTLKHARRGSLPGNERHPNDAQPRNHFAELSWGALLEGSGFSTDLESETDIIQKAKLAAVDLQFAWEVKRPWSNASLLENVVKAAGQIEAAVKGQVDKGRKVDGGVIVIVLDHLAPMVAGDMRHLDEQGQKDHLKQSLRAWLVEHRTEIRPEGFPNVLGVVLWWRPMSVVMLNGRSVAGENCQLHFHCWRNSDTTDWRAQLIWDWIHRIETRW